MPGQAAGSLPAISLGCDAPTTYFLVTLLRFPALQSRGHLLRRGRIRVHPLPRWPVQPQHRHG